LKKKPRRLSPPLPRQKPRVVPRERQDEARAVVPMPKWSREPCAVPVLVLVEEEAAGGVETASALFVLVFALGLAPRRRQTIALTPGPAERWGSVEEPRTSRTAPAEARAACEAGEGSGGEPGASPDSRPGSGHWLILPRISQRTQKRVACVQEGDGGGPGASPGSRPWRQSGAGIVKPLFPCRKRQRGSEIHP
jgi:hypothetical protein